MVLLGLQSGCNMANHNLTSSDLVASDYQVRLGLVYLKRGDYPQAKLSLENALNYNPRSAEAHLAMAYYWEQVKQVEEAGLAYRKALKLQPRSGKINHRYGEFLCKHGYYGKAGQVLKRAMADRSYGKRAEVYEQAGLCEQKAGHLAAAKLYFRKALEYNRSLPHSLIELASLEYQAGCMEETDRLIGMYHRAFHAIPQSLWFGFLAAKALGQDKKATYYAQMMEAKFSNTPWYEKLQKELAK